MPCKEALGYADDGSFDGVHAEAVEDREISRWWKLALIQGEDRRGERKLDAVVIRPRAGHHELLRYDGVLAVKEKRLLRGEMPFGPEPLCAILPAELPE
jgi:hypothetical protein